MHIRAHPGKHVTQDWLVNATGDPIEQKIARLAGTIIKAVYRNIYDHRVMPLQSHLFSQGWLIS
jgi:hypothetical protein